MIPLNGTISNIFEYIIAIVEICSAAVIIVGVARAVYGFFRCCIGSHGSQRVSQVRLNLGQTMVVALEFQVAADILKTGITPNWNDILLLGATIGLRTLLNTLLEFEISRLRPECEIPFNPLAFSRSGRNPADRESAP
jgi:uncharacterized membrane protein